MNTFSFFYEELSELVHRDNTDTEPFFFGQDLDLLKFFVCHALSIEPECFMRYDLIYKHDTLNCETSVYTHVLSIYRMLAITNFLLSFSVVSSYNQMKWFKFDYIYIYI